MPQVVKTHPLQTGSYPGQQQALAKGARVIITGSALGRGKKPGTIRCPPLAHAPQQSTEFVVKLHTALLAIF